jgi:uncharacterized protein YjbI with pentapeptide repeats
MYAADFDGADVSMSDLSGCYLNDSFMRKASFSDCDMRGTCLDSANLQDSQFRSCDLSRATLVRAIVDGADWSYVNLAQARLDDITGWTNIRSLRGVNLFGVNDAPKGFMEWAKQHGAISTNITDHRQWTQFARGRLDY